MHHTDCLDHIPACNNRQDSLNRPSCMKGFSEEFFSPEDYITKITYQIWEGRNIQAIREWYDPECIIRTPHGISIGSEGVVKGTENTLQEFPDRKLLPEDIIIGCRDEGFYSSHRVRSPARHSGHGFFGSSSNREVTMLTVADCLCRDNRIVEEWLVRDQASIARQVGLDPATLGRKLGEESPEKYAVSPEQMTASWDAGNTGLSEKSDSASVSVIDGLHALWEKNDDSALSKTRHRALRFEGPLGETAYGRSRMVRIASSMKNAFPGGKVNIHHVISRHDPGCPVRVSLRWSYTGVHTQDGRYGRASGVPLALLAITHAELRDGLIVNEWMVCDELALYAQIAAKA